MLSAHFRTERHRSTFGNQYHAILCRHTLVLNSMKRGACAVVIKEEYLGRQVAACWPYNLPFENPALRTSLSPLNGWRLTRIRTYASRRWNWPATIHRHFCSTMWCAATVSDRPPSRFGMPEIALVQLGAGIDIGAVPRGLLSLELVEMILAEYLGLGFKQAFLNAVAASRLGPFVRRGNGDRDCRSPSGRRPRNGASSAMT